MTTHEGYLDAYNTNMMFIALVMLTNLAVALFWMVMANTYIDIDVEPSVGAAPYALAWLASLIITPILAHRIYLQKSDTSAMIGWLIAGFQSMFSFSLTSTPMIILVASILPGILTALVIRMMWLGYMVQKTRPPVHSY